MLRHACGYALANKGHDTRAIQGLLGHRSITSTAVYTALAPNRFKDFWRSKRDRLTPSPTAGSQGSDPRPLGPTMGGRPDRTCGERPRASRVATRPKVGPTNCEKNISPLHGVEIPWLRRSLAVVATEAGLSTLKHEVKASSGPGSSSPPSRLWLQDRPPAPIGSKAPKI